MNLMEKYLAQTRKGAVEDSPAQPLRVAVKMYSPILGGYLWVVQDGSEYPELKDAEAPVYDAQEIKELKASGLSPEELRAVNNAKKAFGGEITREKE